MKYWKVIILLSPLFLSACGNTGAISRGEWRQTAAPVLVRSFGMNYEISTVVLVNDRPQEVIALGTDCQKTTGSLTVGDSIINNPSINNVYTYGTSPADKLFAYLCREGLPIVEGIEDKLTAQDRYERARRTHQLIQLLR